MSWPDAFAPNETLGIDQMLPTVPRDFGERFTLDWRAARSPDRWMRYEMRMQELYDDAIDRLAAATGKSLPNPFALPPDRSGARVAIGGGLGIATAESESASRRPAAIKDVIAALDSAREFMPDLPDPRTFDGKVRTEAETRRKEAQRGALVSYGMGGLGAFLGASAGELTHPAQLATLPLGGTYAASAIARVGLLRFIGRAALTEAGVAAGSQIAVEALDAPYQARLGTDGPGSGNEMSDRIDRVLFAAAGGALVGAGLAGLVGAARGIARRIKPTVDEADALKVAERAVYGSERNPLGPDAVNAHAAALNKAEVEVSAGRHADVREIVREEAARQTAPSALASKIGNEIEQKLVGLRQAPEHARANAALHEAFVDTMRTRYGLTDEGVLKYYGDLRIERLSGVKSALYKGLFRQNVGDLGNAPEILLSRDRGLLGGADKATFAHESAHFFDQMIYDLAEAGNVAARQDSDAIKAWLGKDWGTSKGDETFAVGFEKYLAEGRAPTPALQSVFDAFKEWLGKFLAGFDRWVAKGGKSPLTDEARGIYGRMLGGADEPVERAAPPSTFDILDSGAATRPIVDKAPIPPEKPPTGMKEAKADEARAMVLSKDFEITMDDGTKRLASEIMADADDKVKAAKIVSECAAGGAIG